MVRYRCNIVARGPDLTWIGQDMMRAQPRGDMIVEAVTEARQ